MATYEQAMEALRRADAAGNVEDAQQLAKLAASLRPSASPANTLQDAAKKKFGFKDYAYRGTILPFGENADGSKEFATPGIIKDLATLALLPGHATTGGSYTPQDVLGLAAVASPISVASRAGEMAIPGARTAHKPMKAKIPTTQELKAAASQGYDDAAKLGVDYSSKAVKQWADDLVQSLDADGRIAELNPELFALIKKVQFPPKDSVARLESLNALRRRLGDIAGSPDSSKSAAATIAIKRLDGFLEGSDPARVVVRPAPATGSTAPTTAGHSFEAADYASSQGAASEAAKALKAARGNSAAAFRSDRITGLEDMAELRAAAANSGQNIGNTIRQRLASLLASPSKSRGFSPEEIAAIRQVVEGTASTNTLRYVGNLLGGGGGLAQALMSGMGAVAGSAAGGGGAAVGAMLPVAVGAAARAGANKLTKGQMAKVDAAIRSRSPLYQSRLANPKMAVSPPTLAPAAIRALAVGNRGGILSEDAYNDYLMRGGS